MAIWNPGVLLSTYWTSRRNVFHVRTKQLKMIPEQKFKGVKNLTIATTKIYSQQQKNFNAMIIHISFKSLYIDITLVHNANSKFVGVYSSCILYNKTMFQKRGLFWKMKKYIYEMLKKDSAHNSHLQKEELLKIQT